MNILLVPLKSAYYNFLKFTVLHSKCLPLRFMSPNGTAAPLAGRIRQGLCLPSSCSDQDVSNWMIKTMSNDQFNYRPYIFGCQAMSDRHHLTPADWIYTAIVALLVTLILVSSFVQYYFYDKLMGKNIFARVLLAFSLQSNVRYTLDTKKSPSSGQIYCLNGLRFLSMSWVFIGHFALDVPFLLSWTIEPLFVRIFLTYSKVSI